MHTPTTPTEIALAQDNARLRARIRELEGRGEMPTLLQVPYEPYNHGAKQTFHRVATVRAGFTGPHGDLNIRAFTTCWQPPYKCMSIEHLVAEQLLYDAYDCVNILEQVHNQVVYKLADLIQRDLKHHGGMELP